MVRRPDGPLSQAQAGPFRSVVMLLHLSVNPSAGGAGFIRCISASRDRETDAGTLYFH